MSKPKPDTPDIDRMDREIENLMRNPPLSVIQKMDLRLRELRQTPTQTTSEALRNRRSG